MRRVLLLIAAVLVSATLPRPAHASSVDLQIGWHWADGEFWDMCDPGVQSCQRIAYVDVKDNSSTINTISHLYIGNSDVGCVGIPPIVYAFKATAGWGVVSPNGTLGFATPSPHYTDYDGVTWTADKRIAQRAIAHQETLRYILVFQVPADPDDVDCMMKLEVIPASTDTDPNHANNQMAVNVGYCLQNFCDFSAFPF